MSANRIRIAITALSVVGWAVLVPVGVAYADCTTAGDFGAGSGCAPPSTDSDKTESWPPTSVDWPPQLGSDTGTGGGNKSDGTAKPTPIVMPSGRERSPATATTTPIVPVGAAPVVTTTTTPIVAPRR